MNYKAWLYVGAAIIIASIALGLIITLLGISGSFDAMKTAETDGIANVSRGVQTALVANGAGLLGVFVGSVLMVVGFSKARKSKSRNTSQT
jgi:biopolymer transport protein ExbB/TolQ